MADLRAAGPNGLSHNLETVPSPYPQVCSGADYRRSLGMLAWPKARAPRTVVRLGLGERVARVLRVLYELRQARCDLLTLRGYLALTERQLPVARYVPQRSSHDKKRRPGRWAFRA